MLVPQWPLWKVVSVKKGHLVQLCSLAKGAKVPSSWTCLSAGDSPSSSAGLSVPVSVCAGMTRAEGMERACPGYGTFPQYTLSGSSCQHNGMSLSSPENTRVCLSGHFKVFCRQIFSVLRGSEQGASMHAVLLLDTSACKQRQHDSLSGWHLYSKNLNRTVYGLYWCTMCNISERSKVNKAQAALLAKAGWASSRRTMLPCSGRSMKRTISCDSFTVYNQ